MNQFFHGNKEKLIKRYKKFYSNKMESLYKGILKNYSIQLADNGTTKDRKNEIYDSIFQTLEEYITNILPIKMETEHESAYKEIIEEYEKFNTFLAGKLDDKDIIEKKVILLGISRKLFTHSLPLIVAEQCYIKLLKDTRNLIIESKTSVKQNKAYEMLIKLIEDYNIKLLSTKIYWDKPQDRENYKKFWDEYNQLKQIENEEEYSRKKQILFIKNDLKALRKSQNKYEEIINFYKEKLVSLGAMKKLKNKTKTLTNKYTKKNKITV